MDLQIFTERIRFLLVCINPLARWIGGFYGVLGFITWCRDELNVPWKTWHVFDFLPQWPVYLWLAFGLFIIIIAIAEGLVREKLLIEEAKARSKPIFDAQGNAYQSTARQTGSYKFIHPAIIVIIIVLPWVFLRIPPSVSVDEKLSQEQDLKIPKKVASLSETPTSNDPFYVEIPIVVLSDTTDDRLLTEFMVSFKDEVGEGASPVHFGLYVYVSNKQNVRAEIASYTVEAAESLDGPWEQLMPLYGKNNELYAILNGDLKNVMIMRYDKELASVLRANVLEPRDTREGWTFFEGRGITPSKTKFFRFHIAATTGEHATQIIPSSSPKKGRVEVSLRMANMTFTGKRVDMSKFRFKYFHSSIAPPPQAFVPEHRAERARVHS